MKTARVFVALVALFFSAACQGQFAPGQPPYTLVTQYNGTIPTSTDVFRMVIPTTILCPIGLVGSYGVSVTVPTANTVFPITKNGVSIGSLQFNAGLTTVTATFPASITFVAGDIMRITSPASADATLADIAYTMVCRR